MSLLFHQLCPYYVPIRSPSLTQSLYYFRIISLFCPYSSKIMSQLCPYYFPNDFPIISLLFPQCLIISLISLVFPTDFPFHMWIYVDSHDMPILSVRAYIIPISCWFNERDSHVFFFGRFGGFYFLDRDKRGEFKKIEQLKWATTGAGASLWENMEHASKIWPLKKWGTIWKYIFQSD